MVRLAAGLSLCGIEEGIILYRNFLCNLIVLTVACYIWGNGRGQQYAVGTEAPSGTEFSVYVNGEWRTSFTKLKRRYYVGTTVSGDRVTVYADGGLVCSN